MNSRDYKVFREGSWYHVYNRGHNKGLVFHNTEDYHAFVKRLAHILSLELLDTSSNLKALEKDAFTIMAYCLMPNHYHFLIRQNTGLSVTVLMQSLGTSYAKYFNSKYSKVGSVFQDTFKAKVVDNDSYLTYLSAYIHNNPESPLRYEFSSVHEYLNPQNVRFCDVSILLSYFESDVDKYKAFIESYSFHHYKLIQGLTFDH